MFKDKKNIIILVLSIIIIILVIIGVIFILNSKNISNIEIPETENIIPNKIFNAGDEITVDELKTYFEDIYEKHKSIGTSLLVGFNNNQFASPYMNSIKISDDNTEILIHYIPKNSDYTIRFSASFGKKNSDLNLLTIDCNNLNNEDEKKVIASIALVIKIIYKDGSDTSISSNIYDALSDNTSGMKRVYNQYNDIAYTVDKTKIVLEDGSTSTSFFISKK